MTTYTYRCPDCGPFDAQHALGTAPSEQGCPHCPARARRIITAPRLSLGDGRARRLLDATAATADTPAVVTGLPGRSRKPTPITRNPLHAKLPRP